MQVYNRLKKFFIMLVAVMAAGVIYYLMTQAGFSIPCYIHEITGLYCPGCGITRMFIRLIHLDFYGAFRSNPVVFAISPVLVVLLFKQQYSIIRYGKVNQGKLTTVIEVSLIIILLAFGILRNIPYFSFLQPQ